MLSDVKHVTAMHVHNSKFQSVYSKENDNYITSAIKIHSTLSLHPFHFISPFLQGVSNWISSSSSKPLHKSWYGPCVRERSIWSYVVQQSSRFSPWCIWEKKVKETHTNHCKIFIVVAQDHMFINIFFHASSKVTCISSLFVSHGWLDSDRMRLI